VRVALITIAYPPQSVSAAVQMRDLAAEFIAQGHSPVVVVADDVMREPWRLGIEEGIEVLRLHAPKSRDVGWVRRTIAELALPWSMRRALRASPLAGERWDGIAYYSPPIVFGPLVVAMKRAAGSPSYLILRDLFPDWAVDLGLMRRGLAYRVFKRVERQQHDAADVIGIQAPSNAAFLDHLGRASGDGIEVLWNWLAPSPDVGCRIRVAEGLLAGRTIFVYAGNMGVAQGLDVLLELATRVRERSDIGFLFVGRGSEMPRLRALAEARGLTNVVFHDEIDSREVPGLLAQCHVGLLALDARHRSHNIPGKFVAYAQAGLPVLARVNPNNDLVGLIERNGVGRVVPHDDLTELASAAIEMADDPALRTAMSRQGRLLAAKLFSPTTAVKQIVAAWTRAGRRPDARRIA
jgi:glycosyltransferase involved in cell wall biosynthesis